MSTLRYRLNQLALGEWLDCDARLKEIRDAITPLRYRSKNRKRFIVGPRVNGVTRITFEESLPDL